MIKIVRKKRPKWILYPTSHLSDVEAEFVLLLLRRRWYETPLHSLWRRHCYDWTFTVLTRHVKLISVLQYSLVWTCLWSTKLLSDKETFEISRFAKYSGIYYLLNVLNILTYTYIDVSYIIHRYKYNCHRTEDGWNATGFAMLDFIKNQNEPL